MRCLLLQLEGPIYLLGYVKSHDCHMTERDLRPFANRAIFVLFAFLGFSVPLFVVQHHPRVTLLYLAGSPQHEFDLPHSIQYTDHEIPLGF